ncbi:MAG: alkaline phosphatase family protein [Crocinitomicaceae bacterium]
MKKIIFFELNEVPQKIVDYYCQVKPNSWLAKNAATFRKFNSFCENPDQLNPWSSWPTVHRGVDSSAHAILDLNQELSQQNKEFPAIWKTLENHGISTGVFGSLHSYPAPLSCKKNSFYVPDVFAKTHETHPKRLEAFQKLNLALSRKSARNVSTQIPKKALIELAVKAPILGFKSKTITKVASQLIQEKKERWKSTRRRTHQANLSFDLFYKLLEQKKPDFTTFYTNHVAACLHRYWAASFPDQYEVNHFTKDWINRYDGEILFALDHADAMLERLSRFIKKHPEYQLMILSSMGQDAVKARPIESQLYIKNPSDFMQCFGISKFESVPAMLPQFNFKVTEGQGEFEKQLKETVINGKSLRFRKHDNGVFSLELGHINQREIVMSISGEIIPPQNTGLENTAITDQSSTTADHIPEGILYVYHPSFKPSHINMNVIPTCAIYPTLLENFNIPAPAYCTKSVQQLLG